ncbi:MAG: hypothetical protein QXI32_04890, partial [Candidatus Bathyarchaeia archaeon]
MSAEPKLLEFLELAQKFQIEERSIDLQSVAAQLNCSMEEVEKMLKDALSSGLVEYNGKLLTLTDKARLMVRSHREQYIHKKYG